MNLLYRGSVKDLYQDDSFLRFKYSNRYSVFDWGEMPDEIPDKGKALASIAKHFFEYLAGHGVKSHYLKAGAADEIIVHEVAVMRPAWNGHRYDYSDYAKRPVSCLVPLEVIFRRFLGKGNSLEKRLHKNPLYLQDLELASMPGPETEFLPALVEFSTKLESSDRYLSRREISEMNIVSDSELQLLRSTTQEIVILIEKLFSSFGVKLWDGKFEYAFTKNLNKVERGLMLVDSIGPDELRLTYESAPLSKEFLRQIYESTSWYKAVIESKEEAARRGTPHWKEICLFEYKETPKPLTSRQLQVASLLYKALANEVAWAMQKRAPFEAEATLKLWRQQCESL